MMPTIQEKLNCLNPKDLPIGSVAYYVKTSAFKRREVGY